MLILVPTALEWRGLFPELEPPSSAGDVVRWRVASSLGEPVDAARCGFGLAASGARAAALMAGRADRAALAGIAGTLVPDELPVGAIVAATAAEVEGIGFGDGMEVVHPIDMPALASEWSAQRPATPWVPPVAARRGPVLSAAASSGNVAQAAARRRRHPSCVAEDMESEAVLQAAAALGRDVAILRAISNVAGERQGWRTGEALAKLREALDAWLAA